MSKSIADIVKAEVDLINRTKIWIKTRAIRNERVMIYQLASFLRVNIERASEVVGKVVDDYDNSMDLGIDFKIFIVNNQVPDWLREHLTKVETVAILLNAAKITTSFMQRRVHRQALFDKYGQDISTVIESNYRSNEKIIFFSLTLADIEPEPVEHKTYPFITDQKIISLTSKRIGNLSFKVPYILPEGTKAIFNFGSIPFEYIESLDPTKVVTLEPAKESVGKIPDCTLEELKFKTECFINWVQKYGLRLVNCSSVLDTVTKKPRMLLLFASKNDFLDTVRVILPWDNVVFQAKE